MRYLTCFNLLILVSACASSSDGPAAPESSTDPLQTTEAASIGETPDASSPDEVPEIVAPGSDGTALGDLTDGLTPEESIQVNNVLGVSGNEIVEVPLLELPGSPCAEGDGVSFAQVRNIFASTCAVLGTCHSNSDIGATFGLAVSSSSGGLDFSTVGASHGALLAPAEGAECAGARVVPGDPDASVLVKRLEGGECGERMPQGGDPLPEDVIALVRQWISEGAKDDPPATCNVATEPPADAPTFTQIYEEIFVEGCAGVWCHAPYQSPDERRLDTSTREKAYNDLVNQYSVCAGGGSKVLRVAPGDPDNSMLIQKFLGTACGLPMPLDIAGAPLPLSTEQVQMVYDWIAAGAPDN